MIIPCLLAEASTSTAALTSTFPNFANVLGALSKLVVLSLCLERVFAFVFEWEWITAFLGKPAGAPVPNKPGDTGWGKSGTKAMLTVLVSWIICTNYHFDVIQVLFADQLAKPGEANKADWLGILITSFIAAGGSAGAISLFQGVLGFSKEARDAQIEARKSAAQAEQKKAEATVAQAEADKAKAEAEKAKALAEQKKAEAEAAKL